MSLGGFNVDLQLGIFRLCQLLDHRDQLLLTLELFEALLFLPELLLLLFELRERLLLVLLSLFGIALLQVLRGLLHLPGGLLQLLGPLP